MKATIRVTLFMFVLCLQSATLVAQERHEDIIVRAMRDELDRNMSSLHLPGYDKPFFIMYGVQDQREYSVSATLGSIIHSTAEHDRVKSTTRVLVGNYEFNDESLDDNLFSPVTALDIEMPLDDDYLGVRRAFWSSTDNVYRSAARHFQKHQQTLKESGKELKEIPHRTFAKAPPVTLVVASKPYAWDKSRWDNLARNLSSLFLKHPSISYSGVFINYVEGQKYLVNSEGTIARVPYGYASFMVFAQKRNSEGEVFLRHFVHQARTPDELPAEPELAKQIGNMITSLTSPTPVTKFEDEYTGPILVSGSAVPDFLSIPLQRGRENIAANDYIRKPTRAQYDEQTMDSKIGKSIVHEAITVKAKPTLSRFGTTELLGSYLIDSEGIVPSNEVVIIEKGILRSLLNNRTLTHSSQTGNGFSDGPGVLEVTTTFNDSEKSLKEKLLARAKKDGLDYAIIIRDESVVRSGLYNVYKVSVADGTETLLRNAAVQPPVLKSLRKVLGASGEYTAFNLGGNIFGRGMSDGANLPVSWIVPKSILFESLEVTPFKLPRMDDEDYVSNPLEQ